MLCLCLPDQLNNSLFGEIMKTTVWNLTERPIGVIRVTKMFGRPLLAPEIPSCLVKMTYLVSPGQSQEICSFAGDEVLEFYTLDNLQAPFKTLPMEGYPVVKLIGETTPVDLPLAPSTALPGAAAPETPGSAST